MQHNVLSEHAKDENEEEFWLTYLVSGFVAFREFVKNDKFAECHKFWSC